MSFLTLEQFRRNIRYHPFHFWGLADNDKLRPTSNCNTMVPQYSWQGTDSMGRDDVQRAIDVAEARIMEWVRYAPMPRYTSKTVLWPKYEDKRLWRLGSRAPDGRRIPVELHDGKLQRVGVEVLTLLGTVNTVLSDTDGDGYLDTFTLTQATTATDPTLIQVYFSTAERFENPSRLTPWRIRPVQVSISGGIATIKGRIWQIVRPVLYQAVAPTPAGMIDAKTTNNYAATLDVYLSTYNPDGQTVDDAQCTLLWETLPCEGWWCCGQPDSLTFSPTDARYDPAGVGKAIGRVGIRNPDLGVVIPAQSLYNTTQQQWYSVGFGAWREPDRVTIRYQAGEALAEDGEMSLFWQNIITRMAAAELARPICACDGANRELYHWQFDLSRDGGANDEKYQVSQRLLDNPFGVRRGHVFAWEQVHRLRLQEAVLI